MVSRLLAEESVVDNRWVAVDVAGILIGEDLCMRYNVEARRCFLRRALLSQAMWKRGRTMNRRAVSSAIMSPATGAVKYRPILHLAAAEARNSVLTLLSVAVGGRQNVS